MIQGPKYLIKEILLIDDGSTENIQERLEDYIEQWDGTVKESLLYYFFITRLGKVKGYTLFMLKHCCLNWSLLQVTN